MRKSLDNSPNRHTNKNIFSFYMIPLAVALLVSHWELIAQTTQQKMKDHKIVIGYTKLTISEMEDWVSDLLVIWSGEADALNNSWVMKNELSVKIIDNLIDNCKEGILSKTTTKGAIFLLAYQETKEDKNTAIRKYLKSIEKGGWTIPYLQEIIDWTSLSAGLLTIKQ